MSEARILGFDLQPEPPAWAGNVAARRSNLPL
jgi:hypothetical protein